MSIPGERDESVERWLQQLKPAGRAASAECLDAEAAAAWLAGSLSGEPLQQAQAHLADCERCQAFVGTLVRADVGGEGARRPEPIGWLRWPGILVPLTVMAAAAIFLGVWVSKPREITGEVAAVMEQAELQAPAAQVLREEAPVVPLSDRADERKASAPAAAPSATGTVVSTEQARAKAQESRGVRSEPAARELPTGKTAPGVGQTASGAAAATSTAAPAAMPAAVAPLARSQNMAADAISPTDIVVASDPTIRWRIVGRQVQRSIDGGANWGSVQVGTNAQFTAGSAPSRTTCWLVGRGGIVVVTIDGVAWTRVPFPEPIDLAAVTAADNRTATVTTADGRTFRTTDGGKTWVR